MPNKVRKQWQRPFNWPPSTWEFTPGMQATSEIILAFVFILIVATIIGALFLWPILIWKTLHYVAVGTPDEVRNTLLAVGAMIGVPFLIWRTLIAARQADIGKESHYTALFTKAVEQLGAERTVKRREFRPSYRIDEQTQKMMLDKNGQPIPAVSETGEPIGEYQSYEVTTTNFEVRLGAIYALERIAQDSQRDAWPIYLTLCSYVQNNAEQRNKTTAKSLRNRNNSDIEEIFHVLGRYNGPRDEDSVTSFTNLALPNLWIRSPNFLHAQFENCSVPDILVTTGLEGITLSNCDLEKLEFRGGRCTFFNTMNSTIEKLYCVTSDLDRFHVQRGPQALVAAQSKFRQSTLIFNGANSSINVCTFENCEIREVEQFFGVMVFQWEGNVFKDTIFANCDFRQRDLSQNQFQNCVFLNCNLVQAPIPTETNQFIECFTENDLQNDRPPMAQWLDWKQKHSRH
ncbi:pentapeptide repeat-containing protein [Rhizobium laguerreae]|uniref:pentapeptide repeat-containing protein n=1 Tax=Rhizobium laguerreae TaxID=1076926 RepID=UPI001C911F1C|nr:pentapeptide repeat-containing protein [Rhizobium laguerreae]MBY3222787.1 hypothetical protein [Rhizobium laguerreae]